ncbi:hemolysin XhlA family protein [Pectobacterium odoriferum]|uniref:hemolysin XhlA family protein n=1 Tax=Pectobacterium TaxID=122277 RepID=UPI001CD0DCFC|nr:MULTISPECIES: hemolysin XhlA family protein [Pectobacterium]
MSEIAYSFQYNQEQTKRVSHMENSDFERVGRMESDISYIKRDISDLKSDIRELRGDSKEIKKDMQEMRKDMQKDFRLMFSALITVTIGLAAIMAKGFHWL